MNPGLRTPLAIAAVVGLLAVIALALAPRDASSQSVGGLEFADWTGASGNVASGTLRGSPVSLSGSNVGPSPTQTTVDGSETIFNQSFFTPPLAASDAVVFYGHPGHSYTLQFGAPATNPVLHIASLASTLEFPPGTQITRVSGDGKFAVSGNSVIGQLDGSIDGNGTVRLSGTFSSISFSATPTYPPGSQDGIYFQVATPPPPPPPPPPRVTDIRPVVPFEAGEVGVLSAPVNGRVDRVEWDFRGDSRPEVVSALGQTGVRFRPPPGRFEVNVRPVGPGGAGPTISEVFNGPPKVVRGTEGRIQDKIDKLPPVYAAGPEPALLGSPIGRPWSNFNFSSLCSNTGPAVMRSGAVEVKGCLRAIGSIADIPQAEYGILDPVGEIIDYVSCGKCPPSAPREIPRGPLAQGVSLLDGYMARGPVTVNGVKLEPAESRSVVVYPQANYIASSRARLTVGGLELDHRLSFEIDTSPRGGRIPLGTFRREKDPRGGLGGFPLDGNVDVDLLPPSAGAAAQGLIKPSVRLPKWLTSFGVPFPWKVDVRAVDGQLVLDRLNVGPLDADIGLAAIKRFKIDFTGATNEWRGQGKICVLGGCRLDMTPPFGGVVVRNNQLVQAGATIPFNPGVPLFPGVTLDYIGFKVGLDPTRLSGRAGITAAGVIDLNGSAVVAFPSARTPFVLDEPPGLPGHFYGRRHHGPTVAASANAGVQTPIGRIGLSNGYFLFELLPGSRAGYVAFGGGVDRNLADVIEFHGRFDGEFNSDTRRYRLGGTQRACLILIKKELGLDITPCLGVTGVISNRGFGACADTGITSIGGGYLYGRGVKVWPFDGCKWSPFDEKNVKGSRAAQAGGAYSVRIRKGDPSRAIRFDGAGGSPRVRITAPGGQTLDAPTDAGVVERGALKIVRTRRKFGVTVAGLTNPAPGTYRFETLPGSPAVRKVTEANDQPGARVRASVRGRGSRRLLRYSVRRRRSQLITFTEVDAGGGTRTIGTVRGGGRGRLRFFTAPGRGIRRVVAQVELDGMPAEKLTVARFRPPSPTVGRPRRLRVRRKGTRLTVSWRRARGATRYEVLITKSNGTVRRRRTRRARLVVRGISKSTSGRVSVRAVAGVVKGRPAVRRYRATAAPRNRVRALPRCRVGKTKIVCRTSRR